MMKLRHLLPLLVLLLWTPGAKAQFTGGGSPVCGMNAGGTPIPTCTISPTTGTLLVLAFDTNTGSSAITLSVSDTGSNSWLTAATCGTNNNGIIGGIFYAKVTSSGSITITPASTGSPVNYVYAIYNFTGNSGALPADPLDKVAICDAFTTNSATHTSSSISLLNHDAVVSFIVCASGNVGTTEFGPNSPLVSSTGENGGSSSSARTGHVVDNTTVGAQTFSWTSAQGCGFGTYNGIFITAAFVSSGTFSGYPMVIKYREPGRHGRFFLKIPWDNRRRRIAAPESKT